MIKTPLYYMGGKSRAVKILYSFLPKGLDTLVSPFIGGGSFEVYCTNFGIYVYGYDSYRPLINFWKEILVDPDRLAGRLEFVTRDNYWTFVEEIHSGDLSSLDEAAKFYSLNRSSFMAQIGVGISTNPKNNITDKIIERVRNFKCKNLEVDLMDFRDSIKINDGMFLYLDPPYFVSKGSRYYATTSGNFSKEDHIDLFNLLKDRDKWMLSYDNCEDVRELYKDFKKIPLQWLYNSSKGAYTPEEPKELLIFSKDLNA